MTKALDDENIPLPHFAICYMKNNLKLIGRCWLGRARENSIGLKKTAL